MLTRAAGGGAGMMEALVCHPLDTVKVRMQLSRRANAPGVGIRTVCTNQGLLLTIPGKTARFHWYWC